MAVTEQFTPTGTIARALFNFDAFGIANYRLTGTINVSVSDAFTIGQYLQGYPVMSNQIHTSLSSGNGNWNAGQLSNINTITGAYANFANLNFSTVLNYSGFTPAQVGASSDINISLIYRTDLAFAGRSALGTDSDFGYTGSRGDIVLNVNGFGADGLANDYSLGASTFGFHALMHEIGHSLGLSHPHQTFVNSVATLTADFAATANTGFDKLGFHIGSAADMNREYFTIMSYDDQLAGSGNDTFAQTPMILDVIALQAVYGEGRGSSGAGDDTIIPGGGGGVNAYRTYFDSGGSDTIALDNYGAGAMLRMGTTIEGAAHLTGVSMSRADADLMAAGGAPLSLRWFYGEFENASGSAGPDDITDNALANSIAGGLGDDIINASGGGNDSLDGGGGNDNLFGGTGFDLITGGDDNDTISGGDQGDTLLGGSGADLLGGGKGLDLLDGGTGNDGLVGGPGADTLLGVDGFDSLDGGDGNDSLSGGPQGDSLTGGNGGDWLGGGKGQDIIDGGADNDTLIGGLGADTLTGGGGADTFVFGTLLDGIINVDTVTDFSSGIDRIQLSAATFGAFAGLVGQTVDLASLASNLSYNATSGALTYDAAGTGVALTFAILGSGAHPPTLGTDFQIVA